MGSFRRGLIFLTLAALPGPAIAEVCERVRPNWDGSPVSLWSETVMLLGTPISLFLILSTALAFKFRSSWGALAVFVGWSFAVATVTFWDPTGGLRETARLEGCIGTPTLYIALVFATSVGLLLFVNRANDKASEP